MNDKDRVLELSFENSRYFHLIADQNLKIVRLQSENKKLREALEFYADSAAPSIAKEALKEIE